LIYIVTQVNDLFVWRVAHRNGVTETGIGLFDPTNAEKMATGVHAKWNFHSGDLSAPVRSTSGRVSCIGERGTRIEWKDRDHFQRASQE
jgi:hypothetical protein